jgi:hypothetical protein
MAQIPRLILISGIAINQRLLGHCAIICDPLHRLKRIRYRWVCAEFLVGFGTQPITLSFARICDAGILSPVGFLNPRITKMHDVLPLELFLQLDSLIFYNTK